MIDVPNNDWNQIVKYFTTKRVKTTGRAQLHVLLVVVTDNKIKFPVNMKLSTSSAF